MSLRTRLLDWLGQEVTQADIGGGGAMEERSSWQMLAVCIAVSYVANAISKSEFRVYRRGKEAPDDYLYWALNVSPNANESASHLKRTLIERYYLNGEALLIAENDQLFLADSFTRQPMGLADDMFTGITVNRMHTDMRQMRAGDVMYFCQGDVQIRSAVNAAIRDYSQLLGVATRSYATGNTPKYTFNSQGMQRGTDVDEEQQRKLTAERFRDFISATRSAVLPQNTGRELLRFDAGNPAPVSDITGIRDDMFKTVAQAWQIPLSMMTGNITNMSEIVQTFLTFCVDPIAVMIGDEMTRKVIGYWEWRQGDRIVVDTSRVKHIDIFDVAPNVEKLISSGMFTIDDVRSKLGEQPLDTDFSKAFYLTKNFTPAEDMRENTNKGKEVN